MQNTTINQKKERILVIQPDALEQKVLSAAFSGRYELFLAVSVDQALQICRDGSHKVVIFDAGGACPNDLLELERFKSQNHGETPIILLASNNSAVIEMKVAEISVFYYLIKPYALKDLEELIESALRYWQRTFGWKSAGAIG